MADLREPNLPASARRVATGKLRFGWTTGTCSAAAAKAATLLLRDGDPPADVQVPLPKSEQRPTFCVERCERDGDGAVAVVVKDAGDDPDVTHGAHLTARVALVAEPGIVLRGGEGVGTVTKPGLGLEVGGPAINTGPRAQIAAAVGEVVDLTSVGVDVEISVPGGEKMGRRTSNPRLGIMGGISILGTTGIVRPFSTAAWRASVGQAIDVMDAQGAKTVVLTTGGRTEKAARRLLPELPEVCFVEVGDFTGYALKRAAKLEFERCVFVGMAGKLAKLAAGIMMTHWTRSKVDPMFLADVTREAGGGETLAAAVAESNTGRHAWELWEAAELFAASDLLCTKVADNLTSYIKGALLVDCAIVDFDGARLAGASPGARGRLKVEDLVG
ncbi:MAG TPA: cobalt-precorrin-5B (C(1))-methyltransferase [Baekduia sp.]|uniref:cobalt-precorrin-5B (C(1))-methyltransferase n=1 Tax=Baekduia sp. TaxID=2600305 RepID=UPI002CF81021|nr:cobalt-precorrin-5B (C(1))-methyltransferase [Baekduia sp.]HMJ33425.1 cobalt-precorrin-5B (C(1))-methyltransferase [Baekduia sp.]